MTALRHGRSIKRLVVMGGLLLGPLAGPGLAQDDERARHVYEIFRNRCFGCHGEGQEAGLDLRTQASLKKGSAHGPVVVAHQPEKSRLYLAVAHLQQPAMPRVGAKLSTEDVETIRLWIEEGGSIETVQDTPGAARDMTRYEERPITPDERRFWAFQPPHRARPPFVSSGKLPQ